MQAYGPSYFHLDMLMDFLVPQLKVSTVIIQQDGSTWEYGTYSQRNIVIVVEWTWHIHSMALHIFVLRALSMPKFE
jgi:hypothetical protein